MSLRAFEPPPKYVQQGRRLGWRRWRRWNLRSWWELEAHAALPAQSDDRQRDKNHGENDQSNGEPLDRFLFLV